MDLSQSEELFHSLGQFAQKRFGFKKPPTLNLVSDQNNAGKPLGKTAYYDPQSLSVTIYTDNRHTKDILRSLAHELVHHTQNENGMLNDSGYHGIGYAQKNKDLRNSEKEAYLKGNMCFRDWEDGLKGQKRTIYKEWRNNTMSLKEWKNKELNTLLVEKWGFGKAQEQVEETSEEVIEEQEEVEEEKLALTKSDPEDKDKDGDKEDSVPEFLYKEEELEESDKEKTDERALPDELKTPTDRNRKQGQNPLKPNSDLGTFEERLAKEIAAKMLQNESLMNKLRGK